MKLRPIEHEIGKDMDAFVVFPKGWFVTNWKK
jgi:hypothetical protein